MVIGLAECKRIDALESWHVHVNHWALINPVTPLGTFAGFKFGHTEIFGYPVCLAATRRDDDQH